MNRKPWIRISAVVAILVLCLSLPRLFPAFAQDVALGDPHGFAENGMALDFGEEEETGFVLDRQQPKPDDEITTPDDQLSADGDDPTSDTQNTEGNGHIALSPQEPGESSTVPAPDTQDPGEGADPTPDPQPPGADGNDISSEPDGAGDDTASDDFDEGGSPPEETGEDAQDPEDSAEEETELPEDEPEDPLPLVASRLTRSSRTVPGYNVFDVDSYAALAEALSTTSYPSQEHPETSVYILLTEDVSIDQGFVLHSSIERVVIDGDNRYTLWEINLARTQVSRNTAEVTFRDLTIVGNQYYGLFDNPHGTHVSYHYERLNYTGPQILWAFNSTAHFTDCNINITGAGSPAHEVAEIRDVFIRGNNRFHHNSIYAVFYLYNSGSLVLSSGAALSINAADNPYILYTANPQSALRLEDGASLHIEGSSSQLAGNAGLHSIFLGDSAAFHWEAHRPAFDSITINASGGAKDAIYLSPGAQFRVAPNGTPSSRLIRIDSGNVVVGPGASLSLQSVLYTGAYAPFYLAAGSSLTVGNSATLMMDVRNSNQLNGLLSFGGAASSFHIARDATVVIRGNKATGAVYFSGYASTMEVNDPNYLEIVTSGGSPIYFNGATAAYPSTLTYTDVQQLNYWSNVNNTYLNGGRPLRRWVAETGALTINATIAAGGNGRLSTELAGDPLDQEWTWTLDSSNFAWSGVRILSAGKINMEVSSDGNAYQGRITAPTLGIPYTQGAVQLRAGWPGTDRAVSSRASATPEFHVAPNQTVGATDEIAVWAEYGYVFHNNLSNSTDATLSLWAPVQMEFGTLSIPFADMEIPAREPYVLQVQDRGGFNSVGKSLDSTLVVNNVPLQDTLQQIIASSGSETVQLDASLLVPGGAAEAGTYMGNVTWTLVDAP